MVWYIEKSRKTLDECFAVWDEMGLLQYESSVIPFNHAKGRMRLIRGEDKERLNRQIVCAVSEELESLMERIAREKIQPTEKTRVVVLTRSNTDLLRVADLLKKNRIPVSVRTDGSFYTSAAVRDFYTMITSFLFCEEPKAIFNYLLTPYAGETGAMDLNEMEWMYGDRQRLTSCLIPFLEETQWGKYHREFRLRPVLAVLGEMLDESSVVDYYVAQEKSKRRSEGKKEQQCNAAAFAAGRQCQANLDKLMEILQSNLSGDGADLYDIYQFLKLNIASNRTETEAVWDDGDDYSSVLCMTVHRSKGLEFDTVILPYTNRTFPGGEQTELLIDPEERKVGWNYTGKGKKKNRYQTSSSMQNSYYAEMKEKETMCAAKEETRILYVAMTRARTLLTITWSGANGSRFLQEMDPALYRLEGLPPDLSGFSEMENNIERRSDLRLKTTGGTAAAVDWSRESTREVSGNAGQQIMDSGRKVRVGFVQYHSQSKPNSVQIQDTCMHTETYVRQCQENGLQERAARGRISTGHGKAPYCQENESQEAAQIRSMEAVQWLEEISGAEKGKYAGIQAGDALRRVVSGYGVWCKARDSVFESGTREDREWMALIWPQFITSVTEQHLELFEMDPGKKTQYLSVFIEKIFHLSSAISAAEHAQRMQEERYRRYFAESFYPDRQADIWRWFGGRQAANNSVVVLNRFLDCQMHLSIWLSMCLFFMIQPQTDEWMKREMENRNRIGLLKVQIEKEGRTDVFLLKVLAAGTLSDEFCGKLWKLADQLEAVGAVLGECEESRPNEKAEKSRPDDKAEKRAETANRGNADAENPQLCLQGEVLQLRQLVKNNVPELLHLLLEYQKYQKSETGIGGSVLYQKESGVLNRRISDLLENLGITMEESIYQIRRKQERILHAQIDTISETMHSDEILQQPFTRQELTERADVESSIASFEAILDGTLPQVMRESVNRVIYDLKSFDRLTDILPDEKKKLRRFLRIYVPEVVEMLVSYQQYRRGGFDQKSMDGLKTKIQNALDSLDAALKEKQRMIGNMETMRTAAQAETVDELLNSEV